MSNASVSKPLRVALAGAGMISWHHLTAWRNAGERVRLVAICDPDVDKATRRAREFDIPRVYGDAGEMFAAEAIDALDVASPRETHAVWVEAAAARGIHVLCQKPMTPTFADSEALVRRVGDRSRLMVHENWRFRPWYRELKRWLVAGELGTVLLARMAMISSGLLPDADGKRPALERQPFMQHEECLMIAEVLIHHLDVMRYLCGELTVELRNEQAPVGEDEDAHRPGCLDESRGGDRLAGRGRVPEPVAPDRARVLGGRQFLFERLLVDDAEVRVLLLEVGRLDVTVRAPVERFLGLALVGRDQLGEHPGERVHLVAPQLGTGCEVRRLLGQHALETEHEREAHFPLGRRRLVPGLDLGQRLVERVPARRFGREHLGRILVAVEQGLTGPDSGPFCGCDEVLHRRTW